MRTIIFGFSKNPDENLVKVGSQMVVESRSKTRAVFNENVWKWESDDSGLVEKLTKARAGTGIAIPMSRFPMTRVTEDETLINVFMRVAVFGTMFSFIEVPEAVADFITERQSVYRDEDYSHIEVPDCPGGF